LLFSAADPLLALLLVRWVSPRTGRLRSGVRHTFGAAPRVPPKTIVVRHLARVLLLLAAITTTALIVLQRGSYTVQSTDGRETLTLFGSAMAAAAVVLMAIRLWDRRPEPVTVETVRAAGRYVDDTLRHLRAENQRMSRYIERIQAQLSAAGSAVDFATRLERVQTLNANTAQLKQAIRTGCGNRGRQWYDKLEQRALSRSGQRRRLQRA
jgi:hypothetical protein